MRLSVALDVDDEIRNRIGRFVEGMQGFAPGVRWMKPEFLHVTLKFIGEQPEAKIAEIEAALRSITTAPLTIDFRGYGFFPTATAPRVFWIGMEATPGLSLIAAAVDERMSSFGTRKEERAYSAHLRLARGGARSSGSPRSPNSDRPNPAFHRLQENLSRLATPEFGNMTAREFFLYRSELSPKGSRYAKLARFKLPG